MVQKLKSGVFLDEGEQLVCEIEVNYGRKWWQAILGVKKRGYFVLSDQRIVEAYAKRVCCCFETENKVEYVMPKHIVSVGYKTTGCCCKGYYIFYETTKGKSSFSVDTLENADRIVKTIYKITHEA